MQLNAKHYIAIGLGLGIAATYCLHLGSSENQRIPFARSQSQLTPLSSAVVASELPPPDSSNSAKIAKLQPHSVEEPIVPDLDHQNEFTAPLQSAHDRFTLSPKMSMAVEQAMSAPMENAIEATATGNGARSILASIEQQPEPAPVTSQTPSLLPPVSLNSQPTLAKVKHQPIESANDLADDNSFLARFNSTSDESGRLSDFAPATAIRRVDVASTSIQTTSQADASPLQTGISMPAAMRAAQHIEYGKSLSRRSAVFAARQEFYAALNIIAQSKDEVAGGNRYREALNQGFLALKEAEEFVLDNVEAGMDISVASIVEAHRSGAITQREGNSLSPTQAVERYAEFAHQRLDFACGRNVVSAEAFHCLGKLYSAVAKTQTVPSNLDTTRAIVFHRAAVMSDEKNFRSSNELGVLMAQTGRLEEAKLHFKRSLMIKQTPQAWSNLAKAHRRLGETRFAKLAEAEFQMASRAPVNKSEAAIQWVPTQNFNSMAPVEYPTKVAAKPNGPQPPTNEEHKLKSFSKSVSDRLKQIF